MYQRDYILRMIQMMADFIAALIAVIRKGEFPKAEQMLENAWYDFLKQDAAFFRSIPEDKLTDELVGKHHYTHGHLEVLAELFLAEAEILRASGKYSDSVASYRKSRLLHQFVHLESGTYSAGREKHITGIESSIAELTHIIQQSRS